MLNVEKIKFELKHHRDMSQDGFTCSNVLNLPDFDFTAFRYIIHYININEFPISLLSMLCLFDGCGIPVDCDNNLYKKYKRVIIGNKKIQYISEVIQTYNNDQLFMLYIIYTKLWRFQKKIADVINNLNQKVIITDTDVLNNQVYNIIYKKQLHKLFKFDVKDGVLFNHNVVV